MPQQPLDAWRGEGFLPRFPESLEDLDLLLVMRAACSAMVSIDRNTELNGSQSRAALGILGAISYATRLAAKLPQPKVGRVEAA